MSREITINKNITIQAVRIIRVNNSNWSNKSFSLFLNISTLNGEINDNGDIKSSIDFSNYYNDISTDSEGYHTITTYNENQIILKPGTYTFLLTTNDANRSVSVTNTYIDQEGDIYLHNLGTTTLFNTRMRIISVFDIENPTLDTSEEDEEEEILYGGLTDSEILNKMNIIPESKLIDNKYIIKKSDITGIVNVENFENRKDKNERLKRSVHHLLTKGFNLNNPILVERDSLPFSNMLISNNIRILPNNTIIELSELRENNIGFYCSLENVNDTVRVNTDNGYIIIKNIGEDFSVQINDDPELIREEGYEGIYDGLFYVIGSGSGEPLDPSVHCLTEKCQVLTPRGYYFVSDLNIGDEVITSDNRIVRIRKLLKTKSEDLPFIIERNSLGINKPFCDTYISKEHRYYDGIKWTKPIISKLERRWREDYVIYYHLGLENYRRDNIIVNGITMESWDGMI